MFLFLAALSPLGSILYGVVTRAELGGWIFAGVVMGLRRRKLR